MSKRTSAAAIPTAGESTTQSLDIHVVLRSGEGVPVGAAGVLVSLADFTSHLAPDAF
jgi:hypothetical protein